MPWENRLFDELKIGDEAQIERLCRAEDFLVFAHASGNHNPMHISAVDGDGDGVKESIAPSMWVGSLISAVLGNVLPGPGTLYRAQSLRFVGRAHEGDTLVIGVRVTAKPEAGLVALDTWARHCDGRPVCEGEALVEAPKAKVTYDDSHIPGLTVQRHIHFDALVARAESLPPLPTSVAAPESADALEGALLGLRHTLIQPILIGDAAKIRALAAQIGEDLSGVEIEDVPDHAQAAARAVAMVHEGRARAVMKGHLHTDVLLGQVVKREGGLRTGRRLSHIFIMDVPGLSHLLMVTDAAINIAPDLDTKADIIRNAIDLEHALGNPEPRVAVLSAIETVSTKMQSSMDAAILSKMADRGQITGGLVDGPLAMDNAMSLEAARIKGVRSSVAGMADVLVVPTIEAGNMLAKQLSLLAHAESGGLVMGAQVPVILTSRADNEKARLASCAVAALYADWLARGRPA